MTVLDEIEAAIPALRRYAHALLRDRDGADDLVQDCLERAVARLGHWRGDGPVRAWLFRILLNRFRDTRRSAAGRAHLVPIDSVQVPARPGGQAAHLELAEVHAAMGRLPPDQRAALLLVAVEGMSLAEAARALDLPEGTLVSRLGRARAALRAMTGREAARRGTGEDRT
ncbi:MAG: sigma-70 family RNA polymerase sigma factor [Rhodobacteraceae bacterium]|nr:sigma-70 family RNA polymerase sigma factor [Paracoccaceae bacterium]